MDIGSAASAEIECSRPHHQVDAQTSEVAGVMPRGFRLFIYDFDLLMPLAFDPVKNSGGLWLQRNRPAQAGYDAHAGQRRRCAPDQCLDGFVDKRSEHGPAFLRDGTSRLASGPLKEP